jgi:hypothetical protein
MAGKTKPKTKPRQPPALKKPAFLTAYAACGSIKDAARAARIDRGQHYDWLKTDAAYAENFHAARVWAGDALEDEAVERAIKGVFEPNVFQGRFVYPQEEYVVKPAVTDKRGHVIEPEVRAWRDVPGAMPLGIWKKSDSLLIRLLCSFLPEKYGWRGAVEVTGAAGGPIELVERLNRARSRAAALHAVEIRPKDQQ